MYRLDLDHQEEKPKLIYPGREEIPTQNTSYWFAETTTTTKCFAAERMNLELPVEETWHLISCLSNVTHKRKRKS